MASRRSSPWGTISDEPPRTYPEGYDPDWEVTTWGLPPPTPFPPVTTPGPYPNPLDPLGAGISLQDRLEMEVPGDEVEVVFGERELRRLSPVEPVRPFPSPPLSARFRRRPFLPDGWTAVPEVGEGTHDTPLL